MKSLSTFGLAFLGAIPFAPAWLLSSEPTDMNLSERIRYASEVQVICQVFSGRPDPHWSLSDASQHELAEAAAHLRPKEQRPADPSGLGYRGLEVRVDFEGTRMILFVFDEGVLFRSESEELFFVDAERRLERLILESGKKHLERSLWDSLMKNLAPDDEGRI